MNKTVTCLAVFPLVVLLSASAWAQDQPAPAGGAPPPAANQPPPAAGPAAAPPPVVQAPAPAPAERDGARFRFGISAIGGAEFNVAAPPGGSFSGPLFGLDLRLGVQINNLIGVYAQPSLSFGSLCQGALCGVTGTAGLSALVDFTFANRFFVGAGGGVAVLNNPVGPEIHVRLGAYPLMGVGDNGYRRKGLMVGVDTRMYFINLGGGDYTIMQVMGAIGYEAF